MEELKFTDLKSHDYHTLIQQLLPIAIRGLLSKNVRYAITILYFFFNSLTSKVLDVNNLDTIQEELLITLCLLEKCFLPTFFVVMVHLTVHLIREVKLCGPVWYHWMYPFEYYMKVLKGYVRNGSKPEGYIAECYIAEAALEFCAEHLQNMSVVGVPTNRNNHIRNAALGHGIGSADVQSIGLNDLHQAYMYVLENTIEIKEYIE